MNRNYYYLVAGLPDLFLDQELKDFNLAALKDEVKLNIHPDDYRWVEFLNYVYDNENFLNTLLARSRDFSDQGTFPKTIFENLDERFAELPPYMVRFYKEFTGKGKTGEEEDEETALDTDSKPSEQTFLGQFYDLAAVQKNRFVAEWFAFHRDFSNILTALSCRRKGIDPTTQLIGNNSLTEILGRSQAADFGLKREVDFLDKLLQVVEIPSILERERRLDLILWEKADELTVWDYFNINFILAFFIKAGIVARWKMLDRKVGQELFKRLLDDLKATYGMPAEFSR